MTSIARSCKKGRRPGHSEAGSCSGFLPSQGGGSRKSFWLLVTSVGLGIALAACDAPPRKQDDAAVVVSDLPTIPLSIATASGTHRFTVEVARTDAEQQRGLMHRRHLGAGGGMLFPFAYPRTASFWMKDTPIALDLLFVRPDGTVAAILNGQPGDLRPLSAGEPVSAVVEIAGGTAARLGVTPGDRVGWGTCPPTPDVGDTIESFCP